MPPSRPSRQLEDLKGPLNGLILLTPLLAAIFAEKIDNEFVSCALFVGLLGTAYYWLKKRIDVLEASIREQEDLIEKYMSESPSHSQLRRMSVLFEAEENDDGDSL